MTSSTPRLFPTKFWPYLQPPPGPQIPALLYRHPYKSHQAACQLPPYATPNVLLKALPCCCCAIRTKPRILSPLCKLRVSHVTPRQTCLSMFHHVILINCEPPCQQQYPMLVEPKSPCAPRKRKSHEACGSRSPHHDACLTDTAGPAEGLNLIAVSHARLFCLPHVWPEWYHRHIFSAIPLLGNSFGVLIPSFGDNIWHISQHHAEFAPTAVCPVCPGAPGTDFAAAGGGTCRKASVQWWSRGGIQPCQIPWHSAFS